MHNFFFSPLCYMITEISLNLTLSKGVGEGGGGGSGGLCPRTFKSGGGTSGF